MIIKVGIFGFGAHWLNEVLDAVRCDPCAGGAFKGATDLG